MDGRNITLNTGRQRLLSRGYHPIALPTGLDGKRTDEEKRGDYRTKRIILEIYNALHESIRTGTPYQTRLDPPPADPRCCHSPKT